MVQELVLSTKAKANNENPNAALGVEKVWNVFWKAKYGVLPVMMHMPSGYINVSQICKEYDTQFSNWHRLKQVKSMIVDMAAGITLRGDDAVTANDLVIVVKGGSGPERKQVCGTYVHPMLFPQLLTWINSIFAGGLSLVANIKFGLCSSVSRASILDLLNTDKEPQQADTGVVLMMPLPHHPKPRSPK